MPDNCGTCRKCIRTKAMFLVSTGSIPEIFVDNSFNEVLAQQMARKFSERVHLFDIYHCARNRGVLDNLIHELRGDFAINACVIHPFDLAKVDVNATSPDVHGGKSETSVMLALAPQRVRRDAMTAATNAPDSDAIAALIFDRGVSFPWRTDDPRLTESGAIGEAHAASREIGEAIIDSVVREARDVLQRLLENQRLMPGPPQPDQRSF